MTPPAGRSSVVRSLELAIVVVGVLGLVIGGVVIALAFFTMEPEPLWAAVIFVVVAWLYVGTGLLAWWRRPSNRLGVLIVAGGVVLLLGSLNVTGVPVLIAVSMVVATLSLAVAVHLLHAFPSGRLESTASRVTVVAAYVVSLVLQAPIYLFTVAPSPYHLLVVADRPDLGRQGGQIQAIAGAAVMAVTVVILAGRLRRADRAQRRIQLPVLGYSILAVLFIPLAPNVLGPVLGVNVGVVAGMQILALAGIPVAFVLGVLRGGFARTGQIEELGAWLGTAWGGLPALAEALARTLGDDSLRLVFWVSGGYVDASGRPAQMPGTGSGRSAVDVSLGDRQVGAIVYDATLIGNPEIVRAAGRVVAIAVDNERLTAELRASEAALRQSRARIVEAADQERRLITRNLHDGLQVQLVLLALDAQRIASDPAVAAPTRQSASALREGIDAAATDLRQLVHAVMPAALVERGLSAAAEDLVDRIPVPTHLELHVPDGTLAATVETTAYFVLAEGLANALKYANAGELDVRLVVSGEHLHVEVRDDGVGGASIHGGSGLRGLADRVDTLGGWMQVNSPAGHGTHLVAALPCES
jgi:signal transduction histidine kinase